MNHYTYLIEFTNGMKYIGVRSCKCSIEQDSYLGSSKIIPSELYATCTKTILNTFKTRVEAVKDEIRLHQELSIAINPEYYNQVKQTSHKFDQEGTTKETHKHIKAAADKLRGRTKMEYVYLEERGRKFSAYRGKNRTEAQLNADKYLSTFKGTKNPKKANIGTKSPKYRAWYYITPNGEYLEVYTTVMNYCDNVKAGNWFNRNQVNRALRENTHKPMERQALAGYTFGYIDTKPAYLDQESIIQALQVLTHLSISKKKKP